MFLLGLLETHWTTSSSFFFVVGCGEDVDVFESSKPSLQNKKKKEKSTDSENFAGNTEGNVGSLAKEGNISQVRAGGGADLHGSLWTCILSGHSPFGGAALSAPCPLASWRVLLPEISPQWVAQA